MSQRIEFLITELDGGMWGAVDNVVKSGYGH